MTELEDSPDPSAWTNWQSDPSIRYGGQTPHGLQRYTPVVVDDQQWSPYNVIAWVEATPAGLRCVDLRIVAKDDGNPITPAGLRRVPLGRIIRLVEDLGVPMTAFDGHRRIDREPDAERRARATYRREVTMRQKGERRWRLDEAMLARVAQVYRDAIGTGAPPTAAVQEYFRLTSRAQAARWVKRAREEGHLRPAPGRRLKGEQ